MIHTPCLIPRDGRARRAVPFRLSPLAFTLLGAALTGWSGAASAQSAGRVAAAAQEQAPAQAQTAIQAQTTPPAASSVSGPVAVPGAASTAVPSQDLPAVTVSADRDSDPTNTARISAGALGERKQVDTPFSTVVKSSEEIKDLMAGTANDVFKYDPSVVVIGDNATSENSTFSVRGMQIDMLNGVKVDGQNFPSWDTDLPLEPFEQVQLLKGLGGFMYGFGSPGGILNYVLKRPTDQAYRSFSIGYKSAGVFSESVDLGGRFGTDDRFGYRLNAVNEEGNTAEADGHIRRQVASLALDFRITPDLTLTADALYQKRKQNGTLFGILVGADAVVPDAGSVTRDLTQPQNFYQTEMASFGTGLEYRISDDWKASVKYRFAKENRTNSDSLLFVSNNAGDYSNTVYSGQTRYFYSAIDTMVEGKLRTGSLTHHVVIGAGYQSQTSEYDNNPGWNAGYALGNGNIYTPIELYNPNIAQDYQLFRHDRITQASIYASDTVQITDRWSALLGLRYTQYRQNVYNPDSNINSQYSADPVTPTAALMFKTDPYSTVYASYVESLEQGGSASVTNVNYPATYGPLKSRQYELGYKADHEGWGANVAVFRVDQGYQYTNAAGFYVQDGKKRYTGVDASGWFAVGRDWRVLGGVLGLAAKGVDIADPTVDGKRVYGAPRFTATARVEYSPPVVHGLVLNAGVKYISDIAVDATNQHIVPSYTTFDLGARYETMVSGKNVIVRAGIDNLFNKRYWTTGYGYYILPGATRTFAANATLEF
jgi:iron complex outermembrane recepter protein